MKIGIILPGFSADERDWCIPALYNFVRTLAAQMEIHVFALEYPYRRDQYSFFGAHVHALGGAHRGKLYAPRLWSDALSEIFVEHRRASFDLLHAFWVNKPGVIAGIAARLLRLPFIASVAGGELVALRQIGYGGQLNRVERMMINSTMRSAHGVTVGSRYLKSIAEPWRNDVRVLSLGVDTHRFSALDTSASPFPETRILNVGSLNAVKGQALLLDAFSQLGNDAQLEIVGAGVQQKYLQIKAKELKISQRVIFSGEVPHNALPQKYREASLFVQSSLHEAQGIAVLEAVACGCAVVGTPVGIVPELAECGAAIAADGFHADALADAIHHAIEQRKELACRAREIAETEFSLAASQARWIDLYNSI